MSLKIETGRDGMQSTSNAATADKKTVMEKVAEKRRALGRGLESLLPGPRVVIPPPREQGAPATISGTPAPPTAAVAPPDSGWAGTPVAPPDASSATGISLQEVAAPGAAPANEVQQLSLDKILDNPNQTRMTFEKEPLDELAASIAVQGVLQPIVVRPMGDGNYILIMGERRVRASRQAQKTTIPAIVKRVSEQQAAEMTVIENLQRQDLDCIEQANAFSMLSLHFNLTQEEIGKRVGVSRESVANYMRLLKLPQVVIRAIQEKKLSYSHARLLLRLGDEHALIAMVANTAIIKGMSVLQMEEEVERVLLGGAGKEQHPVTARGAQWVDPNVKAAQRALEATLGMRVRIRDRKGKGRLTIEYASLEDFDRLVGILNGKD
jgi:ParB family chromosome partitioning protein